MSLNKFADLENQCQILLSKLRHAAGGITGAADNHQLKIVNSDIEKYQRQMKSFLARMDAEVKSMPPSGKRASLSKIMELRNELQSITSSIQTANEKRARMALLGNAGKREEDEHMDRMEKGLASSTRGTEKLADASRKLMETQEIGVSVVDQMKEQGQSLLRSGESVTKTRAYVDHARTVMRRMKFRAFTNKFLLLFVIFVLLGSIGTVVYFGYIASPKHGKSSD